MSSPGEPRARPSQSQMRSASGRTGTTATEGPGEISEIMGKQWLFPWENYGKTMENDGNHWVFPWENSWSHWRRDNFVVQLSHWSTGLRNNDNQQNCFIFIEINQTFGHANSGCVVLCFCKLCLKCIQQVITWRIIPLSKPPPSGVSHV